MEKDVILSSFVFAANSKEAQLEMGVTLNVGGTIVSGILIGYNKYLESIKLQFDQKPGGEFVASFMDKFLSAVEEEKIEEEDVVLPIYIHLKDARFFTPGNNPIPNNGGILWRGKLSSIDGFNFGALS